jgi:DNA (cytosine-5)-methyltransferase 1
METPYWSLKQLGLNIKHLFAVEKEKHCRKFIQDNCPDLKQLLSKVEDVSAADLPDVDIFAAGFPCQPFSSAGRQEGAADERGTLFAHIDEYLKVHVPKVVILENVPMLKTAEKFAVVYAKIKKSLKTLDYCIFDDIMDTMDHGLPHSRKRLYVVCIRKDVYCGGFTFPPAVEPLPLMSVLDSHHGTTQDIPKTATHTTNLARTIQKLLNDESIELEKKVLMVDVNVGLKRAPVYAVDKCPCITRSRGACGGYFVVNKRRMTTVAELIRLQGFTEPFCTDSVSNRQLGAMVIWEGFESASLLVSGFWDEAGRTKTEGTNTGRGEQ